MDTIIRFLILYYDAIVLTYAITIVSSYIILGIYSAKEIIFYKKKNSFVDYRSILSSTAAPSISILAPAYNEQASVVENAKSLLSLHYGNYEVILINDGSKDDSLIELMRAFDLHKVDFAVNEKIKTKPILGVFKSSNIAYSKLIVVDKENGGKADALNAGINISSKRIITCIDVDCIIMQDALVKMVKPFMEETTRVIASGGVIRIANSCVIEDGRLIKANVPSKFLPRIQVIEYIRSFLMGRMAWSKLNGLIIVSGALGFFDKEIVIACGGYNHNTVGEDMELVVRMRRYMHEQGQKYKVVYIPDPLCWTEAPADLTILGRQRNRWTRGTAETLWIHKSLFFNPRYGMLGMLSYPYWFFFEWMAPLMEFTLTSIFLIMGIFGLVNWPMYLLLFGSVYFSAILISTAAIIFEELSYYQYKSTRDVFRLCFTVFLEPFFYHPMTVWWAVRGNYDLLTGKKSWGTMTRKGFGPKQ